MRKKLFLIALTVGLNIFTFNLAEAAKPPYCEEALNRCIAQCDRIFEYPFNNACRTGCWIGYQNCGAAN